MGASRFIGAGIGAISVSLSLSAALVASAYALEFHELSPDVLKGMKVHTASRLAPTFAPSVVGATPAAATVIRNAAAQGSGVPGIDSVVNFTGAYRTAGFDPNNNPQDQWYYAMVGNSPDRGGVTTIDAPIIPVIVELLDANGDVLVVNGKRMVADPRKYVGLVEDSPVFAHYRYTSSESPTQFTDAVFRAAFWSQIEDDWHTVLRPLIKHPRVMQLPYGSYYYGLNTDGSLQYVLASDPVFGAALFPPVYPVDASTPIGAAELYGDITTKTIGTFLFDNVYLYENNDPTQCCVLGYHSFDAEPGTAANGNLPRFYVMDYASWITPGLFGGGFEDVTALSHEMSEIFNDPFVGFDNVHNITPWWLSPGGLCSDLLEVGDVVEGNATPTYPITLNGYTYHPQTEALLPWFEFKSHPRSLGGAYSYPDATQVTALSPVEQANCP
jgi:hypothetical protein